MADHPHNRRKGADRRSKPSATQIGRENLRAAENLVRQSGNRLAIGDAMVNIKRARRERDERIQRKRGK